MPIYKGSTELGTIYHGDTKMGKVYMGSTLVSSGQQVVSVYNIYATNQVQKGSTGFFLGEPGANNMVVGGISTYKKQAILTYVLGTINNFISGTPGTVGSSLFAGLYGTSSNYGPYSYLDNYIDSYGSTWYRYKDSTVSGPSTTYVLLTPFHTTVGSQLIYVGNVNKSVFSSDASTITFYAGSGESTYNAASTICGTFQYK